MIDLKKKCWREKVTAEITVAHMLQSPRELGTNMSAAEVAAFLNQNGRAQDRLDAHDAGRRAVHQVEPGSEPVSFIASSRARRVASLVQ